MTQRIITTCSNCLRPDMSCYHFRVGDLCGVCATAWSAGLTEEERRRNLLAAKKKFMGKPKKKHARMESSQYIKVEVGASLYKKFNVALRRNHDCYGHPEMKIRELISQYAEG